MEPRVSTAPDPKTRKWPKNSSATCLLRQPSGKNSDVSDVVARPQTCPTPGLTPQFHWNLNNSALKTLPHNLLEQLYGLFKFYDSSTIGDSLPSINSARFVAILRDTQLLIDSSNPVLSSKRRIHVDAADRIFAQAVMGKMRVYLDADGQPALTFALFCGALMNCGMLLSPLMKPAAALQQLVPMLLESFVVECPRTSASVEGLLSHIPADGTIAFWESCIPGPESIDDFRKLPPFQQVIADCEQDKALEELKQEIQTQQYQIPDNLITSFHPDTIAFISNKFRIFDVFNRGRISRQEVFPLLSSLGKHADLPDPYTIVTKLEILNAPPRHPPESGINIGNNTGSSEITLAELLHIVKVALEAKRHLTSKRLAPMKIGITRVDPAAQRGATLPMRMPNNSSLRVSEGDGNNDREQNPNTHPGRNKSGSTGGITSSKERGRRHGIVGLKSHKSTLTQGAGNFQPDSSSRSAANKKHPTTLPGRKRTVIHRRKSSMMNGKPVTLIADSSDQQVDEDHGSAVQPQRSGTLSSDNTARDPTIVTKSTDFPNSDIVFHAPANNLELADDDSRLYCAPSTTTEQVRGPSSDNNRKMVRVFLLLGGEHDGAMFCTLSLAIGNREIVESEGIYYSTAPSETTRTAPVLPTQHNLINALLMLKRCVLARMKLGFELRPADQLAIVDDILQDQWKRQPHFSSPVTRIPRGGSASPSPASLCPTPTSLTRVSSSHSRFQKLPPHSIPTQQLKLPNNYKNLGEVSQRENYAWIHEVNAMRRISPTRSQSKSSRAGHLTPLHF